MVKEIDEKQWESNGAKSRAMTALKERRAKRVTALKDVLPEFEIIPDSQFMDQEKLKKTLARVYEGYALYVKEHKDALVKAFEADEEQNAIFVTRIFLEPISGYAIRGRGLVARRILTPLEIQTLCYDPKPGLL